jgi:glycosyltransferase involved in cell wall biosynthesis
LRIVQIIPDFGLGGVQKAGCVLGTGLAGLGHPTVVIGRGGGVRFRPELAETSSPPGAGLLRHQIVSDSEDAVVEAVEREAADVVHVHAAQYDEGLVRRLAGHPGRVIVSTPVFGRPPLDRSILSRTRTCVVGVYTFYRLCRWLGVSGERGIASGLGYVPLTPYEPPASPLVTTDPPDQIAARRAALGVPDGAAAVGRIGRASPEKWHPASRDLVDALLARSERMVWLSVGFPDERGRAELAARWGARFINLPETPDYNTIARVLSSLDVGVYFGNGECFSASICEAAGAGVPQVVMANPLKDNGQAEQIIDGVNGYLVGTTTGAVDAVLRLIDDPALLARMRVAAREHAVRRWHRDRVVADLVELYRYWSAGDGGGGGGGGDDGYVRTMLREHAEFAREYRPRMLALMGAGAGPLRALANRAMLAGVESWTAFRLGRFLKRLRHGA